MAKLRVVKAGDETTPATEMSMAEAIEAIMRECIAAEPVCVMLAWEHGKEMSVRALPDSTMVRKGFAETIYDFMFEPDDDAE